MKYELGEVYWEHSCKECDNADDCYKFDYCHKQNCELDQVKRPLKNIDKAVDSYVEGLFDKLTINNRSKK